MQSQRKTHFRNCVQVEARCGDLSQQFRMMREIQRQELFRTATGEKILGDHASNQTPIAPRACDHVRQKSRIAVRASVGIAPSARQQNFRFQHPPMSLRSSNSGVLPSTYIPRCSELCARIAAYASPMVGCLNCQVTSPFTGTANTRLPLSASRATIARPTVLPNRSRATDSELQGALGSPTVRCACQINASAALLSASSPSRTSIRNRSRFSTNRSILSLLIGNCLVKRGSARRRAASGTKWTWFAMFKIRLDRRPEFTWLPSELQVVVEDLALFFGREVVHVDDDLALLEQRKRALLQVLPRAVVDVVARGHDDLRAPAQHGPDLRQVRGSSDGRGNPRTA